MEAQSPEAAVPAENKGKKLLRICIYTCVGLFILICLVAAVTLITWAACHPRKPRFTLDDVSAYPSNSSQVTDSFSISRLMVTLTSFNPSRKNDIYYGNLAVYLSTKDYKTEAAYVDGMLQEHKESSTWTVALDTSGGVAGAAQAEQAMGEAVKPQARPLQIKGQTTGSIRADGWIKYKFGHMYTGKVKIHVECPVIFNLNNQSSAAKETMRVALDSRCSVHRKIRFSSFLIGF